MRKMRFTHLAYLTYGGKVRDVKLDLEYDSVQSVFLRDGLKYQV